MKTPRTRGRALQRLREQIFTRDCGLCQECKRQGRLTHAVELDHIQPLHKGGTDAASNLEALCVECHLTKTAADEGRTRRAATGLDGWPADTGRGSSFFPA